MGGDRVAEKWPRDLWLDALWEDETVRPNERLVAYVYARYAGPGMTTWASWDEIKRRTGLRSKDAVWRAIDGLKVAGWLVEDQKPRQHRSAVYRLGCPVDNSAQGSGKQTTEHDPEVRETDLWNPEVRETAPEVRETVARGPGNGKPDLRREIRREIRSAEPARSPSGARADDRKSHAFVLGDPGLCRCGLLEANRIHSTHRRAA